MSLDQETSKRERIIYNLLPINAGAIALIFTALCFRLGSIPVLAVSGILVLAATWGLLKTLVSSDDNTNSLYHTFKTALQLEMASLAPFALSFVSDIVLLFVRS